MNHDLIGMSVSFLIVVSYALYEFRRFIKNPLCNCVSDIYTCLYHAALDKMRHYFRYWTSSQYRRLWKLECEIATTLQVEIQKEIDKDIIRKLYAEMLREKNVYPGEEAIKQHFENIPHQPLS